MRTALASLLLIAATAHADEPLSAAQRFAREAIIVDTHIDAPSELMKQWRDLGVDAPGVEFDYPRARQGGLDVAFMSIYTSPEDDAAGTARQKAHMQIDAVEALAARHPDRFALLRSPADVERLSQNRRVLLALGMENGAPIGDDLAQLEVFHRRGVRYVTLAHSHSNRIADGSYSLDRPHGGLSPFGEQVVKEMNRLGIMVDVSHLSDDAVRDVLRVTKAPVIASHSGMRRFTPGFERNLSDALAKAIAKNGGVVQIVFGSGFIDARAAADTTAYFRALAAFQRELEAARARGETPAKTLAQFDAEWDAAHPKPETRIEQVVAQIDHAVKLLGEDHVGIGSDFDGVGGALPVGLKSVADYPNLIEALRQRGYSDERLRKILGGNLLRVWREVEARAEKR
ncbi:dipeptidase [Vulcaniibacterium thermophilum]|uniref:Dipeptidase n=1 Tax=Vulcaniibacterium thermophilum TaxID=1169913 RepID=A0A919DAL7_9GAMM|nr:dipeptidase [Vulcaniibacterium thermophilum]GHE32590.1 dipeptidase [Vulcaniibacterium thermophilum]